MFVLANNYNLFSLSIYIKFLKYLFFFFCTLMFLQKKKKKIKKKLGNKN